MEILHEGPFEVSDLDQVHYAITNGDCSGKVSVVSVEELGSKQMAEECKNRGSDP